MMFLHGSLCLELQLDVSSSFPLCIGPSRTSKIVKTSSKNCTMVQYLAPLGYDFGEICWINYIESRETKWRMKFQLSIICVLLVVMFGCVLRSEGMPS
jgi:hypothetical protein